MPASHHSSNWSLDEKDRPQSRDHDRTISDVVTNLNASDPAHTSTEAAALPEVQGAHDVEKGGATVATDGRLPGAFDPRQNPDGGKQAWLCVVGCFCCLFCSFGKFRTRLHNFGRPHLYSSLIRLGELCRHLPELLPNTSTCVVRTKHSSMDYIVGDLHELCPWTFRWCHP